MLTLFERSIWTEAEAGRAVDFAQLLQRFAGRDESRVQVVVETVFTDDLDPTEALSFSGVHERDRANAQNATVVWLVDKDGEWLITALKSQYDGVYHLIATVPRSDYRWKRVERWISRARGVSRCYLNHEDFLAVGDQLATYAKVELVTISSRMRDGSSLNRGFPARTDSERPDHREGISEIEDRGGSVRTLALHINQTLDLHLRRLAGATFNGGSYVVFREVVLRRLEAAAAARRDLLSGRARKSASEKPRPLTISLPSSLLKGAEDTGDVLDVISSHSDLTLAVFHRNPYLHFVVTDEHDGSNFDVLVTREDAIDIYPGYRSSPSSLARVSQLLSEAFGALEIQDQPEMEPVSLYDLV